MSKHERKSGPVRGVFSLLLSLFFMCCLLIAAFAAIGYAAGWIEFGHDEAERKSTIEIETGEMQDDVENAVESGREMIEETGESLQDLAGQDEKEADSVDGSQGAEPAASERDAE